MHFWNEYPVDIYQLTWPILASQLQNGRKFVFCTITMQLTLRLCNGGVQKCICS